MSGIALGQILAGPATALASPERLLLLSAGTCLAGCVALLAIPAIRTLRRAAPADGGEPAAPGGPDLAAAAAVAAWERGSGLSAGSPLHSAPSTAPTESTEVPPR